MNRRRYPCAACGEPHAHTTNGVCTPACLARLTHHRITGCHQWPCPGNHQGPHR